MTALAAASSADAQITVKTSPFIVLPTGFNGFEQIGSYGATPNDPPFVGPYTEGGITVEHNGNEKIGTVTQAVGNYSWYDGEINPGYTSIKLADGGNMDAIQFLATSLWLGVGAPAPLQYQILLGGQTIAQGYAGSICDGDNSFCNNFKWYGFSGATFDEVRVQSNIISYPYDWNPSHGDDALVLDNISVHAVPEPASWALMMVGLGVVGSMMRRSRPSRRVAFA